MVDEWEATITQAEAPPTEALASVVGSAAASGNHTSLRHGKGGLNVTSVAVAESGYPAMPVGGVRNTIIDNLGDIIEGVPKRHLPARRAPHPQNSTSHPNGAGRYRWEITDPLA